MVFLRFGWLLLCLLFCFSAPVWAQSPEDSGLNWYDGFMFQDRSFGFEFIRILGHAYGGGADLGECISTARAIREGDDRSWYEQWSRTADRVASNARDYEKSGHRVSARQAYLRASNYYRAAGFYLHDKAGLPLALETSRKGRECFHQAIALSSEVECVQIPYQGIHLPGYFIKATGEPGKAPLLIVHSGFDGTAEEEYFEVGKPARERGYHCLIFEGPGQGAVIREQGLPFRYDWESVVTPVVDYAVTRPDVDRDGIALMGISMGGYLAPRAAAFEHRLKACVANGGIFDFSATVYRMFSPEQLQGIKEAPQEFEVGLRGAMKTDTNTRWFFNNGMYTFGVDSPVEFLESVKRYSLEGVAQQITCPTLVVESEDDQFMKGQAKQLFEELECPKTLMLFTREEAAQAHCQEGAVAVSNARIFNWLDQVMKL
jgi:alpha-beta hydrolase superfamily lysophospholipase